MTTPSLFPIVAQTYEQARDDGRIVGAAQFSPCGLYRQWLSRIWDDQRPFVNFLLLNPSKATAELTDNTMERCNRYAFDWGFGGQFTTNIFDFRATLPDDMKAQAVPSSPANDVAIVDLASRAGLVVCGWGTHGDFMGRGQQVIRLLEGRSIKLHCLRKTADGHPNHPLYLRKNLKPIPFP